MRSDLSAGAMRLPNDAGYKIACDCGDSNCDLTLDIRTEGNKPALFICGRVYPDMCYSSWFGKFVGQIAVGLRMMLGGHLKCSSNLEIVEINHIHAVVGVLLECKRKLSMERRKHAREEAN